MIPVHDMVGAGSTVYLGFPIWWMAPVWLVNDSVKSNDFAGKTIIPFCTSASSDIGNSASTLQKMAGKWYMAYRAPFLRICFREGRDRLADLVQKRYRRIAKTWGDHCTFGCSISCAE